MWSAELGSKPSGQAGFLVDVRSLTIYVFFFKRILYFICLLDLLRVLSELQRS